MFYPLSVSFIEVREFNWLVGEMLRFNECSLFFRFYSNATDVPLKLEGLIWCCCRDEYPPFQEFILHHIVGLKTNGVIRFL